jgi:hypothetical protein
MFHIHIHNLLATAQMATVSVAREQAANELHNFHLQQKKIISPATGPLLLTVGLATKQAAGQLAQNITRDL